METSPNSDKELPSSQASNYYKTRSLTGLIAILTALLVLQILRANSQEQMSLWIFGFISIPATVVGLSLWYAFQGHQPESRARMKCALIGGLLTGALAFFGGFVSPLLVTPESNQGPLFGFFITGPIGLLTGTILGALYAIFRSDRLC